MAKFFMVQSFFSIAFAAILILSTLCISNGFSVDLIHRDSPKSPSYNPALTPSQRLANALRRSFGRVNHFTTFASPQSSSTDIIPDHGEYLMKISIGTPPSETLAIADTGSDLIWTQCQPCVQCFNQKNPLFNPSKSSTYKKIPCEDKACQGLKKPSCDSTSKSCLYSVLYGDRSFSIGDLATDTITLGTTASEKVSLPNTTFGCGHKNGGTFGAGSSGIVGLGGGKVSLISQMAASIHGKFSYCLVPFTQNTKSSKINFGDSGVVSGAGVVTTPIVPKSPDTYYFLTLESISVGTKKLEFFNYDHELIASLAAAQEGNIIIDSGTTLTILPSDFYTQLESQVKTLIKKTTVFDPLGILRLCYESLDDAEIPAITMHFKGGDVKLNSYNTFVNTTPLSRCLAFAPAQSIAIYGNIAQTNFLVGYDLEKKTVSLKATDCAK